MFFSKTLAGAGLALAMIATFGVGGLVGAEAAELPQPNVIDIDAFEGDEPQTVSVAPPPVAAPAATRAATTLDFALPPTPVIQSLTNLRINDPAAAPANATDIGPAVAAIGDKVLAVWYVRGPLSTTRLRAAYSMDAGATFTDAEWLPPLPGNWRWTFDPCVEADPLTDRFFIASQAANPTDSKMGVACLTLDLQSGGNLEWGDPTIVIETAPYTGSVYINQLHMKFDVTNGRLHLVYRDHFDAAGALDYRSSLDGVNWSPLQVVLSDGTHKNGDMPHVGLGLYGPLVTYFNRSGFDGVTLRSQRTLNPPTWDPPVTATSFREELSSVPGTLFDYSSGASMAVDRTLWLYQNRIYAAWVEGAVFPTWPQPSGDVVPEVEPNATPAQATPVVPAAGYIQGDCLPMNSDVDWYAVNLNQGQHLVLRPAFIAPHTANGGVSIECYASDGVHGFGSSDFQVAHVGFGRKLITAPVAGTYYLRVSSFEVDSYAFSLAYSSDFTFPRDRRELYTAYSADGGASWSTPVPLYAGAIGFDVADPTLCVGNDGRPYLFWHDFSVGSANGTVSATRVSRSSDGGASWETPVTLATAYSDWQPVPLSQTAVKMGWRIGAATTPQYIGELAQVPASDAAAASPSTAALTPDAAAPSPSTAALTPDEWMHVMWTDARDGETNIYGTRFPTGFEVIHRTTDTTAVPGQLVGLRMVVENRNTLFPQTMNASPVIIQRNWPVLGQSFFVNPGQRWVGYPVVVTVPDTAAAGDVFVQGSWSASPNAVGMNTFIHVSGSPIGVEPGGPSAASSLEFAAPSPNPALTQTTFRVTLPAEADATLEIFDVRGARVRTLLSERAPAGAVVRSWDLTDTSGRRVAPGLYLARVQVEGQTHVRRVAVID